MMAPEHNGYVVYRGASALNGKPIAVIAIMKSLNTKTGNLVQTYILADGEERPTAALRSGADDAVCGDCKHRPANAGTCYVVVRQGATVVWQHLRAGSYPDVSRSLESMGELLEGRMLRLGTYGDPAAVPIDVWRTLTAFADNSIGYTHQWMNPAAQALRPYCMASVDTPGEKAWANALGWRTFRVRMSDEPLEHREGICPASDEAGHKLQCTACGACNGEASGRRGNIAIIVHGAKHAHQPEARFIKSRGWACA